MLLTCNSFFSLPPPPLPLPPRSPHITHSTVCQVILSCQLNDHSTRGKCNIIIKKQKHNKLAVCACELVMHSCTTLCTICRPSWRRLYRDQSVISTRNSSVCVCVTVTVLVYLCDDNYLMKHHWTNAQRRQNYLSHASHDRHT